MPGLPFLQVAISHLGPAAEQHARRWALNAVDQGADAFLLREPELPAAALAAVLGQLNAFGLPVLLRSSSALPNSAYSGIHRPSTAPWPLPKTAVGFWGRSCHSLEELQLAQQHGYHYAFLSPVYPTNTHPDAPALGLALFSAIVTAVDIPVFALGGVTTPSRHTECVRAGAWGSASIERYRLATV